MSDTGPWLSLIGLGEDGPAGLSVASRTTLESADVIMGPPRHLSLLHNLLAGSAAEIIEWPVPFRDGLDILYKKQGRKVAVLLSGDPFFYGAGRIVAEEFGAGAWQAFPSPSAFSLAASRLGWPLERVSCLGLHAAPLSRLRPHLAPGQRAIVLLRDGEAVRELAQYLTGLGFGDTSLSVLEALGGPRERITQAQAHSLEGEFSHPVVAAIEVAGSGAVLTAASGRDDSFFEHDGQISKRPIRALALSALAPRPGERLWDIGSGSGSIAIEWLLSHPACTAISLERDPERAARIARNASALGVDRLHIEECDALERVGDLPAPDAVFIGGGLSEALLTKLHACLPQGTRIVAHAVTLGSEALLTGWQERLGGSLTRFEMSEAAPLGPRLGWKAAYPIVQWRVEL